MRRLKDHSGLTLAALSSRTAYSKSSWERYLNGKKLPPRAAVEELARVTDTDPTRLSVLYEVAWEAEAAGGRGAREAALATAGVRDASDAHEGVEGVEGATGRVGPVGSGPSAAADGPDVPRPEPVERLPLTVVRVGGAPPPPPPRHRAVGGLLVGAVAGFVVGLTALFAMAPWDEDRAVERTGGRSELVGAHEGAFPKHPKGKTYRCDVQRHDGRTYAGHSATRQKVIEINSVGWEVVEAQCLLREAGFSPQGTDGIYGDNTVNAVKRFQKGQGLADDGAVGPETWKALRK
ncbi:peptidoglycan-binding protein [Streptomyces iconiensis]|uniref:Peptidoglycan-binding protein n=2 Tax=Streptomyces iconiensis TaxID=1384038 RepID=A0ABT7A5T6_9ACTN|nr:peptidoglycan-binding protein [Streptomyces iconiensis]MDJ1135988.1 peptidoglycan-binding protein [Streptomyces iconiensis]